MHIDRWDLDCTYLDTSIQSIRGLLRAAVERPESKQTLPGAAELVHHLQHSHPDNRLCFLSGSPRQMETVLREKLALDGLFVHEFILKDNLRNLKRGRFKAIKAQVSYKLPALLQARVGLSPMVTETLFGDDSESDAAIYVSYREILAGRMGRDEVGRILELGNAYPDQIRKAFTAMERLQVADGIVQGVFIRLDRRSPHLRFRCLGEGVYPVHSWYQAAVVLWCQGRLTKQGVTAVAQSCGVVPGTFSATGLLQDMVRRALISPDELLRFAESNGLKSSLKALKLSWPQTQEPRPPRRPDIVSFLRNQF